MKNLTFSLLAVLALAGCPKGSTGPTSATDIKGAVTDLELLQKPEVNFQNGLFYLQPDKKTGNVDYAQALTSFVAAGNLGGGAKAWFNAGWAAEKAGKPTEAEQYYRKAFEADANYDKAVYSLARVLQENKKAGEAAAVFKAYADAHPTSADARTDYIQSLVVAGQFDAAIKEAQAILIQDPKNASVYRNLSALYYAQGNYSMSQLTGEKALGLNDADAGTYNNMGVTYLLQKNEPAAIEKFKMAIQLDGKNFEANMNLGWVALSSGDYGLAHKSFLAANEVNPSSVDAQMGLAIATRGTGDFDAADKLYRGVISADPMNQDAYFNAATLHERYTKDFAKALAYLEDYKAARAGQISPSDPVFARIDQVAKAKAAEEEKKRIEAEKVRAEKERQERNAALLKDMGTQVTALESKINTNAACLDPSSVEEVMMVIEQAKMVVEAQDTDMAADMKGMLDTYGSAVDEALTGCTGGGSAPAPDAGTPPADGTAPAPAEGAAPAGGEPAPTPAPQ